MVVVWLVCWEVVKLGVVGGKKDLDNLEAVDSRMVEVVAPVGSSQPQEGAVHTVMVESRMDSFMKCGIEVILVFCWVVNIYFDRGYLSV